MPQDLRLLARWVTKDGWPQVTCPVCGDGHLVIEELKEEATAAAKQEQLRHPDWDPTWIRGYFHGQLRCGLGVCKEQVVVAGDYAVDVDVTEDGRTEYVDFYILRFAYPPLKLISIPVSTPDKVREAIERAGAVVWTDPGSAANRLRTAIEELLTSYGMRRFVISKASKRVRLSTHQRIDEFRKHESVAAETLMAVKWIGNEGSHEGSLTVGDVLDGAELLAHALRLLYDRTEEEMARKVRAINRRKGLPRARPTTRNP